MSQMGKSNNLWFGTGGPTGNFYDWQLTPTFPIGLWQVFTTTANLGSVNTIANGADVPFFSTPALASAAAAEE